MNPLVARFAILLGLAATAQAQSSANSTSPATRAAFSMAYDSTHAEVVLFGGFSNADVLNDTWVWDGENWSQKSPQSSPPGRGFFAMTQDASGRVILFGGVSHQIELNDTWIWDGAN
jgi:hypothetical protein